MKKIILLICIIIVAAISMSVRISADSKKSRRSSGNIEWRYGHKDDKQDYGKITVKKFNLDQGILLVANFTSINMEFVEGNPGIEVRGPEKLLRHVILTSSNNTLKILDDFPTQTGRRQSKISTERISIKISGHAIGGFSIYGSGNFRADRLIARSVSLMSYGSGDMNVEKIEATAIQISTTGSGDIAIGSISGSSARLQSYGSGDISVGRLIAAAIENFSAGSGDINVTGIDATSVKVQSSGSGDTRVSGRCTTSTLMSYGSGDINARGLKSVKTSKIRHGSGSIDD